MDDHIPFSNKMAVGVGAFSDLTFHPKHSKGCICFKCINAAPPADNEANAASVEHVEQEKKELGEKET